jgi:hypothetical protein
VPRRPSGVGIGDSGSALGGANWLTVRRL